MIVNTVSPSGMPLSPDVTVMVDDNTLEIGEVTTIANRGVTLLGVCVFECWSVVELGIVES